ncbi:PMS1 protein homolog 1-like [Amphiura filiformis]|uniref:PMS1 protein homolog 1-like n=1 Tax=Amphiura filiformis TaxID=82378 RepID=UPI003B20B61F
MFYVCRCVILTIYLILFLFLQQYTMSSLKQLSGETVRLITSSQVITSVYSVVKELVENSLDANADNIDVKLENFGFDKIEVRDNGDGITTENALYMAQKHYTSKISDHGDLEALATYGFRGEALGSLCAVSNVSIVTKTKEDAVSNLYTLDHHGMIASTKPSHMGNGTTVTATNLFKNIPVRRQYYSNTKRCREELKKVEDLLMSYGAIRHDIRVSLSHNKKPVWQKNKTSSQRNALLNTWGGSVMKQMTHTQKTDPATQVTIEAYLPKLDSDHQLTSRSVADRCWISVNKRPVTLKEIEKTVKQYYSGTTKQDTSSLRHLVMYVDITMPTHLVDVNLEPNKTRVLLQNSDAILSLLTDMLQDLYGPLHGKQSTDKVESISSTETRADNTEREDLDRSSESVDNEPHVDQQKNDQRTQPEHHSLQFKLVLEGHNEDKKDFCLGENNSKEDGSIFELPSHNTSVSRSDVGLTDSEAVSGQQASDHAQTDTGDASTNDFTDLKSCELIPSTQPEFNLMDSSLDIFCDTATETNEPIIGRTDDDVTNQPAVRNAFYSSNQTNISESKESSVTGDMTSIDWSKGVGLKNSLGCPIQPSVLLVPGKGLREKQNIVSSTTNFSSITGNHIGNVSNSSSNQKAENQLVANDNSVRNSSTNHNLAEELSTHLTSENKLQSNISSDKDVVTSQTTEIELCTAMFEQEAADGGPDQTKSPGRTRRPLEEMSGQTTLYDIIESTAVKRPVEAFAFFSRQFRAAIVKENPNLDFAAVNSVLEKKWEELSEDVKREYQKKGQRDIMRYHEQVKNVKQTNCDRPGVLQLPPKKKKKLEKLANQNLIDEMLSSQGCKLSKKKKNKSAKAAAVKEVTVRFSVLGLGEDQKKCTEDRFGVENKWRLIGQISSNNLWLAVKEHQLLILNQYRIEEALLYTRLMATHILPVECCEIPVLLNKSMLGGDENWVSLLSLQSIVTPPDPDRYFVDERLKSNGFHIKQTTDPETSDVRIQLIAMATCIPYYGIHDLKEILDLITQGGNSLAKCRALKTSNYLQGEAMRMARNLSADLTEEEIYEIISRMEKYLLPRQQECLHGKPFIEVLYDMNQNDLDSLEVT